MKLNFSTPDMPPNPKEKENYILEFDEDFDGDVINTNHWLLFYLPQWSSKQLSKPNYELKEGNLILKITKSQAPWCPEFDGEVKCSSIQTGVYSGKSGTNIGQHKFNPACVVREEQQTEKKYVPQYGYFEIRAKALNTKSNVVSLWMIGFEDHPERCGEICVFEIKGKNVKQNKAKIGFGIHQFNDSKLKEAFFEETFAMDVTQFHIYAAEWTPEKVCFFINNRQVKEIYQSPGYPMQLMLGIYELPVKNKNGRDKTYPKEFVIDYVRGYKRK